jgi:hypothetical protein
MKMWDGRWNAHDVWNNEQMVSNIKQRVVEDVNKRSTRNKCNVIKQGNKT